MKTPTPAISTIKKKPRHRRSQWSQLMTPHSCAWMPQALSKLTTATKINPCHVISTNGRFKRHKNMHQAENSHAGTCCGSTFAWDTMQAKDIPNMDPGKHLSTCHQSPRTTATTIHAAVQIPVNQPSALATWLRRSASDGVPPSGSSGCSVTKGTNWRQLGKAKAMRLCSFKAEATTWKSCAAATFAQLDLRSTPNQFQSHVGRGHMFQAQSLWQRTSMIQECFLSIHLPMKSQHTSAQLAINSPSWVCYSPS